MNRQLLVHQLVDIKVDEIVQHKRRGRPGKDALVTNYYQLCATLIPKQTAKWMTINNYTAAQRLRGNLPPQSLLFNGGYLLESRDLFKMLCNYFCLCAYRC